MSHESYNFTTQKPFCNDAENDSKFTHKPVADGGQAFGPGFCIAWQRGPTKVPTPLVVAGEGRVFQEVQNGAFLTDVLAVCVDRLDHYQTTAFASEKNAKAAALIREAVAVLEDRLADREAAGVLGTHERPDVPGDSAEVFPIEHVDQALGLDAEWAAYIPDHVKRKMFNARRREKLGLSSPDAPSSGQPFDFRRICDLVESYGEACTELGAKPDSAWRAEAATRESRLKANLAQLVNAAEISRLSDQSAPQNHADRIAEGMSLVNSLCEDAASFGAAKDKTEERECEQHVDDTVQKLRRFIERAVLSRYLEDKPAPQNHADRVDEALSIFGRAVALSIFGRAAAMIDAKNIPGRPWCAWGQSTTELQLIRASLDYVRHIAAKYYAVSLMTQKSAKLYLCGADLAEIVASPEIADYFGPEKPAVVSELYGFQVIVDDKIETGRVVANFDRGDNQIALVIRPIR